MYSNRFKHNITANRTNNITHGVQENIRNPQFTTKYKNNKSILRSQTHVLLRVHKYLATPVFLEVGSYYTVILSRTQDLPLVISNCNGCSCFEAFSTYSIKTQTVISSTCLCKHKTNHRRCKKSLAIGFAGAVLPSHYCYFYTKKQPQIAVLPIVRHFLHSLCRMLSTSSQNAKE